MWTQVFGGINYQIEHHLFPSMSHMHYPRVAPIVQSWCAERGIPYVSHSSVFTAYGSFLRSMKFLGV